MVSVIKIIGIVGSPRKGNTETMVRESLKSAKKEGAETEIILVRDLKLEMCDGCLQCDETGKCHFEDGMNEINEKLASADGLVIGTPARWGLLSGNLKVFMDRTNPLAIPERLAGKKVAILSVGQCQVSEGTSIEKAAESVATYCHESGMEIVGEVLGFGAIKEGDVKDKKETLIACRRLGKELVKAISRRMEVTGRR